MWLLFLSFVAMAEDEAKDSETEEAEDTAENTDDDSDEISERSGAEDMPSASESESVAAADDPYPMHYDGFGGVSLGVQRYIQFSIDPSFHELLDGRETLPNNSIGGTVVTSYYFSRISNSRLYVGYAVSAMFSDKLYSSKDPTVLMNPYCPAYDAAVEAVNGGQPGGDYNTFRPSEGTYTYGGQEYEYGCMNNFGVRTNRETLVHIPAEFNMAWVGRPTAKTQVWVSAGTSINWYDYKYRFSQNGFSSIYDSYYGLDVDTGEVDYDESYFEMYWSYDYEERFGASKNVEDSGWKAFKESYLLGFQVATGGEYIFGELPRIGGEWGLGLLGKYSYVRGSKQTLTPSASMDSRLVGAAEKYAYKEEASMTIKPNLSNVNLSASLIWHY